MSTPLTPGCSINISPLPNITPAIADCGFKVPLLPRLHGISIILVTYACCQGVKHFPISLPNCCLWSLWTFSCASHCFNVQFRVPTSRDWTSTRLTTASTSNPSCFGALFWTFSVTHTALTSNFACRLPGIGLPHGLPLLQHPIRHALALFLDFLCDSLCSNVQFRVPASRDWTSTQLTIGSYSDISYLGSSTITAS